MKGFLRDYGKIKEEILFNLRRRRVEDEGESCLFLLLFIILLLISFACFWESKKERKGLRVTLSITLALMLSILMEGAAHSLVEAQVMEGPFLITLYFVLPIVSFTTFQILFYDIRMMGKEK